MRSTRSRRCCRAGAPTSATSLEGYATCPQRFMLERLLRVRAVEEPEQVVRIDALSKRSVIHRIFERFYDEWRGTGPAPLAPDAERRMRRIAGEECDAARDRGETGYPAMWEADRVELIEDCVRWLGRERDDELTRAAAEGRGRGAVRPAQDRGEAGDPVADRADRDRAALRRAAPARPDRPGQLGRAALPLPRGRLQERRQARQQAGELQGGRMLQLPLVRAGGGEAARDRPGRRRGRVRLPDTQGRVRDRRMDAGGPRRPPRRRDRAARRDRQRRAARRLHHRPVRGRVQTAARSTGSAPAPAATTRSARRATTGSPDSRPRSGASSERRARRPGGPRADRRRPRREPRRRGRRRAPARRPCSSSGSTNVLATGAATVDELVVITFTEKAAAELSTRVRDALERRAGRRQGEERERMLAAARDLYRCHIETIHSFATSLLRERPVEAGIDPLFDVVDGLAGSLSFDAAYEAFQDELLSTPQPRARPRAAPRARPRRAARGVRADQPVPLPAPAQPAAPRGRRARHAPDRAPPDRRRARGRCCAAATPARTPALTSSRGSSSGPSSWRRSAPRPSRSSCCCTATAPTPTSARARRPTGARARSS